jgi:hypothetical protein
MNVWVLTIEIDYSPSTVVGVYSTHEAAMGEMNSPECRGQNFCIAEFVLGGDEISSEDYDGATKQLASSWKNENHEE